MSSPMINLSLTIMAPNQKEKDEIILALKNSSIVV